MAATGLNLTIDAHVTALNGHSGLGTILDQARELEELAELNLAVDRDGGVGLLSTHAPIVPADPG